MAVRFACPECRAQLSVGEAAPRCETCGTQFDGLEGVPILVAGATAADVDQRAAGEKLPGHDCRALGMAEVDAAFERGDEILELGAGCESAEASNLTRTDAYVYDAASLDAVADAHALPFADGSFDFVFSLAVFEHLHSPWVAAQEIARVLKPGGRVYVLCAFFQQLHGYPDHYFNASESGLRRLFRDEFEVERCGPSEFCGPRESTVPLFRMEEMAAAAQPQGVREKWRLSRLKRSLRTAAHQYQQLEPLMLETEEGREAWRHVTPAVELVARRR